MKNNSERPARRQFSAEAKWQILREGRSTNLTISQVCDQHQISPTLFYQWERAAERGARQALQGQPRGRKKLRPSEEALLNEIQRLREVIADTTLRRKPLSSPRSRRRSNGAQIKAWTRFWRSWDCRK